MIRKFAIVCALFVVMPVPAAEAKHRSVITHRVRAPYPGLGTAPSMEQAIRATWPGSLHRAALNVAW